MKIRILYNQDMGNGGGTPAPSSPAPAAAAPAAQGSGSSNPQESFASALRDIAGAETKSTQQSQPASDGNQAAPESKGAEGDLEGRITDDQGTTADGEVTDPEGKGAENKWSEDDQTFLKAQGLDSLPWSSEVQKIVKSGRELRSQYDRVSQSNSNAISQAEVMRQAVYKAANGDPEALQKAFGVDLQLDRRTPESRMKEIHSDAQEFKSTLEGVLAQLEQEGNQAAAQGVVQAWNAIASKLDGRANVIKTEEDWQKREADWLRKAGKNPDPKDAFSTMKGNAEKHLAMLTQEDKDASLWFKAIEDETKPGGALAALNIDLPRAYGTSPQVARFMNQIGKSLATLKNMPQILAAERKRAEADFERKQSQGGPRGSTTGGSARGSQNANPVIASLEGMFAQASQGR